MPRITELLRLMGLPADFGGEMKQIKLLSDIHAPDWNAVRVRVDSHPEEAQVLLDPDCPDVSFPVNIALYIEGRDHDPVPADVIGALIRACPDAVSRWTIRFACRNARLDVGVIEAILEHDASLASTRYGLKESWSLSYDIGDGDLPLHTAAAHGFTAAARVLIRSFPEALGVSSSATSGGNHVSPGKYMYPIHWACTQLDYGRTVDPALIRLLIEEGTRVGVGGDRGAGGLFLESPASSRDEALEALDETASDDESPKTPLEAVVKAFGRALHEARSNSDSDVYNAIEKRQWENVSLCLRAAGGALSGGQSAPVFEYPLIHAAISFGTADIVSRAVDEILTSTEQGGAPLENSLAEKDPMGRSPLDVLLEKMERFPSANGDRRRVLSKLVAHDCCGTDVVLASVGLPTARALYRYAAECGADANVLMTFLRAHPSLVTCRGVETTGLYPFMLLATMVGASASVDHVFYLLRSEPSLVKGGIIAQSAADEEEDSASARRRVRQRTK